MLCANLALNGIVNMRTLLAGAGRERGLAQVPVLDYTAANNFGGVSLGVGEASEPVDIIPVDALGLARCELIKIDVEGMEGEVLAGAASTIARHRPVLYVENDRREKSAALIARLLSTRLRALLARSPAFQPRELLSPSHQRLRSIVSFNMLGVSREADAQRPRASPVAGPQDWPFSDGA